MDDVQRAVAILSSHLRGDARLSEELNVLAAELDRLHGTRPQVEARPQGTAMPQWYVVLSDVVRERDPWTDVQIREAASDALGAVDHWRRIEAAARDLAETAGEHTVNVERLDRLRRALDGA